MTENKRSKKSITNAPCQSSDASYRIMFVCHGNICRSPMAEFVLKQMLHEVPWGKDVFVASSATSREEICCGVGNPVYPPAKAELLKHGIFCDEKRAVQLQASDYECYDLFIGMDQSNIRRMHDILGADPRKKIKKLMDYTSRGGDVADPWYSERFDIAFRDIYDGCEALMQVLAHDIKTVGN